MQFCATVRWQRSGQPFIDNRYSRAHAWQFDGGATVVALIERELPVMRAIAARANIKAE